MLCISSSPTSEYGGGGGSDRQTASFFGNTSSRPAPVYGPGAGGSSMRSMAGGRFTGGAGNGLGGVGGGGVASTTRFSTARHEGFRMNTPTRVRPSHGAMSGGGYGGPSNHGLHVSPGGTIRRVEWERTSPIHGLSYGRNYR